jgi:hypothetical protein
MTTEFPLIERWYSVDSDAVVDAFKTNREDGLTTAEVEERVRTRHRRAKRPLQ